MFINQLVDHNISILLHADELLRDLGNDGFTYENNPANSSSIGMHVRHVIDHYLSFMRGIRTGTIDYDDRERNPRYEKHLLIARNKLHKICQSLEKCKVAKNHPARFSDSELSVSCDLLAQRTKAKTSIERELVFLHSHAIHHFALIRMLLNQQSKITDQHFGVAPSTIAHRAAAG